MAGNKGVIFIDNGVTGTIGWYTQNPDAVCPAGIRKVPVHARRSFHKVPRRQAVVSVNDFEKAIRDIHAAAGLNLGDMDVVRERPMINPTRFAASMSACRTDEAESIALERIGLEWSYIDSKNWQRGCLPSSGVKGVSSSTLKAESLERGLELFGHIPEAANAIRTHRDADSLMGAYIVYSERYGGRANET